MKSISVLSALSTRLDATLTSASSIEIDDEPFAEGGFGRAYRARSIDSRSVTPQVIKLLTENGMARRGFETIQELQKRLRDKNIELLKAGSSLIGQFPALRAVPQLSFEGRLAGRSILGYAVNDLTKAGFEDFGRILDDEARTKVFQALSLASKMRLAAQLVAAFDFLSSHVRYIHADFKAQALFVDLTKIRCAIIDYDSGALARDPSDTPTTFGTEQDWLAPEIVRQLHRPGNSNRIVKVDLLSDVWSVNIAIHYLLAGGLHPLFFLTEISERSIEAYFRRFQWPDVAPGFPYFRKPYSAVYEQYVQFLKTNASSEILSRFAFTINKGYRDPTARTTYSQWKTILQIMNRPAIRNFGADRTFVTDARPVRLSWNVSGAARLEISGVGNVTDRTWIDVSIRCDTVFKLVLTPDSGAPIVRRVRIEVSKQPPTIHFFMTDRLLLTTATPARLSWNVTGAEKIDIDQGVGDISGRSSIEVLPKRDSTFKLTATSPFGVSVTTTVHVRVSVEPPVIAFFHSDRSFLVDQRPVELSWKVSDEAHEVLLSGIGPVSKHGTLQIDQRRDAIYVLTATSFFGNSSVAQREVLVSKAPPVIEDFKATPPFFREGLETLLTWKVSGADRVRIEPQIGSVPAKGQRILRLSHDERFSLRAESFYGISVTKDVSITVLRATTLRTERATEGLGTRTALSPRHTGLNRGSSIGLKGEETALRSKAD